MNVEIWSDVVCPYCYVGKHQFEKALDGFDHASEVTVTYKSFELQPDAEPFQGELLPSHLAKRLGRSVEIVTQMHERVAAMGAEVGIVFDFEHAKPGNTFDAHRLIHFAAEHGKGHEMFEALHEAYFRRGLDISSRTTLQAIAQTCGFGQDAVGKMLESDDYASDVRADEQEADELQITGVPFFVIDRKYGISGAQGEATFKAVLQEVWTNADGAKDQL
ncbi:MAG: DsbA family oxidoreductase [Candidatus Dormibacteria bacterium]